MNRTNRPRARRIRATLRTPVLLWILVLGGCVIPPPLLCAHPSVPPQSDSGGGGCSGCPDGCGPCQSCNCNKCVTTCATDGSETCCPTTDGKSGACIGINMTCCNGTGYPAGTGCCVAGQWCANNTLCADGNCCINGGEELSCSGTCFDPTEEYCCGATVIPYTGTEECCFGQPYCEDDQQCCESDDEHSGSPAPSDYQCCNGQGYPPDSGCCVNNGTGDVWCENGSLCADGNCCINGQETSSCSGTCYDPTTTGCCGPGQPYGTYATYNLQTEGCCNGWKYTLGSACCTSDGRIVPKTPILSLTDCPNRVSNPNSPLQPDGCSVPLWGNGPPDLICPWISFSGACTNHDYCYQACNQGANQAEDQVYWHQCNVVFANNMTAICNASGSACQGSCYAAAAVYYNAVDSSAGWSAYVADQEQACLCCQ
jgi:hypothetical protein